VRDDSVGVLVDDPAVEAAAYLGQCRGRTVDCGAASGFENSGLPYLKMLRPDLGGGDGAANKINCLSMALSRFH